MPGKYDMTVWRGNSYEVSFTMKNADGVAVDLTGRTLVFRAEWTGGSYRLETGTAGTGGDLTITNAAGGIVTLEIDADQTRNYPLGARIDYEIEQRDGPIETTILYGRVNAIGGVNDDA